MSDNQFIFEVLQQVAESQGNAERVHSFLKTRLKDLEDLDETLVDLFSSITKHLLRNKSPEEQEFIAQTLLSFSICISEFPLGNRALNLELARVSCNGALEVYKYDTFSEHWATATCHLGNIYFQRIERNRAENIEQAIIYYQAVLNVGADAISAKLRAAVQNQLGNAYVDRIQSNRAENIEQAIKRYEAALNVYKRDYFPNQWAATKHNLGSAYYARIREKRADNLEAAIQAYREALTVRKRKVFPIDWATTLNGLANAYCVRIKGDRAINLELAIKRYRAVLLVRKKDAFPMDWATTCNSLGDAYYTRIRGKRADNLEAAIQVYRDALTVRERTAFPIDWATTCNNLANVYRDRIKGERKANLEKSIEGYKDALTVRTKENFPVDWAQTKNNLSIAYYNRIQGGRAANLEEAIEGYEDALTVRKREDFPVDWATTRHNLATAYYARIEGDRAVNLEKAIEGYEKALTVRKKEDFPVNWAQTENNLANAYFDRLKGDKNNNLGRAIESYKNALMVRKKGNFPVDWAQTKNNLANAYSARLEGDENDNIQQAIEQYEASLEVYTRSDFPIDWANTQYNLASTYARCIDTDGVGNTAINYYEKAIDTAQQALEVFKPKLLPNECRLTARLLGNLYSDQQQWNDANTAYGTAIEAAEVLYQSALSRSSQESELAETNDLFRRATFAQAKIEEQLTNAVTTIEQGRARGLRETLERDRADLSGLKNKHKEIYEHYQQAAAAVRQLESDERSLSSPIQESKQSISETELRRRAETVRQDLSDALAAIRQCPGYESFLEQPSFDDIAAAIQPGQPLVYLLATPKGGLALIVHKSQADKGLSGSVEITSIWLNTLTNVYLRELLVGSGENLEGWFGAYIEQNIDHDAWLQEINQVTHKLWKTVMEPVVTYLKALKVTQAVLVPTGNLSLLPLHTAWTKDTTTVTGKRYALDEILLTYSPNARTLSLTQEIAQLTKAESILAIDEPKHRYEVNERTYKDVSSLPNSSEEVQRALATFQTSKVLSHEQATKQAVLSVLPEYNVLHCSCHGKVNFQFPLKSGLAMAGDGEVAILSLRDLLNLKLEGVRLAILSACETGLPGLELPDEVVSLSTGLLQAGVAGVVASLWLVSDLSTMLLLSKFYELWRPQTPEVTPLVPSEALRQAQRWLRDSTDAEIASLLGMRTRTPSNRRFASPYYWAAFNYTGV